MRKLTAFIVAACVALLLPCVANGAEKKGVNEPIPLSAPLDKASLMADIVSTFRPVAEERGYDLSLWEAELRGVLAARSEGQLLSVKNAASWADAKNILGFPGEHNSPAPAGAASRFSLVLAPPPPFGDTASNLVYFPVQPCRLVDSRIGTGGNLGPIFGNVNIVVNGSLTAQGGNAAGCGIPSDPAAVALNFIAVTPGGTGFMKAYPFSTTEPNASVINFTPAMQNVANMVIVPQCQICGFDVTYGIFGASTHVVIDIVGYFWNPNPHDGMPATGRGYALVNGTTLLNNRGFSSVSNPSAGEFCLVPNFDWANVKTAPVVSAEWSLSAGNSHLVLWKSSGSGCPAGQIDVLTFDISSQPTGTLTNEAFTILVP